MILILDFDRTLYDVEGQYRWLEEEEMRRHADAIAQLPLAQFLYDDVVAFVKRHAQEHTLMLCTFGARDIQGPKVEATGIAHYFTECLYTDHTPKADAVCRVARDHPEERVVFVDDDPAHLVETKELCPRVLCVRMRRPGAALSDEELDSDIPEIHNLAELERHLQ